MFWVPFLLLAWALAGITCIRLCLVASHGAGRPADPRPDAELSIYEAAFLSGGPDRVAALAMIAMARQRRLLLAHTGWATVVDPDGKDDLERSVLGAIGPAGQSPIAPVRHRTAGDEAVRRLAERLTSAGLAVPDTARGGIEAAVRQVQAAALAIVGLGALSLLMWPDHEGSMGPLVAWFLLPLILTLGCLAIARYEVHPYTRWASSEGQQLLGMLEIDRPDDERGFLTAVAVRGPRAVTDPALRAAFGDGR
ncbi:TIGR04222 domain-containing membrane protein [Streptomyces sp. N35]|uniref:TIGR04222 domain-containing membrane protein n=1 Tax=Streptomyces sp. N35 TaxID=2795730 RepID=UPI0018F59A45|nr:TIGR04222 domain-containing membrane protein [Streptomyces sp. N35]